MRNRAAIGRRSRRVTLDLLVEVPDGFGGVLRSYQPGPQLWGALEFLGARERQGAGRTDAVATHRLTVPFRPGLGTGMRVRLGPRCFGVRQLGDPDGSGRSLVLLLEELAP